MKRSYLIMPCLPFVLLTLFLQACDNSSSTTKKDVQKTFQGDTTLAAKEARNGNRIDYDNTPVLNIVLVTAPGGVYSRQQPEEQSAHVTYYEYGHPLEVIEVNGKWLGIRDRVSRKFVRNGHNIESTGWEKIYVPKSATGKLNDITLSEKNLNIIEALDAKEKTLEFENGTVLSEYLKLEFVDKQTFEAKRRTAVSYLRADTTTIRKKNGVLNLPITNGFKQYQDKNRLEAEDNVQEYSYVGQIDFLDAYVIAGTYWESWDYKLINKHSGAEEVSLNALPYISYDKSHLICISANPYTSTADLELHNIKNNKVSMVMAASFKYWAPVDVADTIFWGVDGALYLAVLPTIKAFYDQEHSPNAYQYIRIRVLSTAHLSA